MTQKIIMTDKKRMLIFINMMITCVASSMMSTSLTTAMPQIINDFDITVNQGQWMTSGYSLAMAIIMPLTAFLINRFSTKKLYFVTLSIVLAGLIICGVAVNFPMMMAGRIVQAVGNGMSTSLTQVVILTIFPLSKRGSAMGWYGLAVSAAPVVAPTLAGIVIDMAGWRVIFFAVAVIMAAALVISTFMFENVIEARNTKFDLKSFVLSAFAFGGITLGIGNIGSYGISSAGTWGPLTAGVVGAVLFCILQLRLEEPFLDIALLKNKEFAASVLGSILLYFVMMGSSVIFPLYIQQVLGLPATISGIASMPGSLVMAVISPFTGKIYDKVGIRILLIIGSMALIISNIGMFFVSVETSYWVASGLNMVRCVSIGCLMMPLVTWGADKIERSKTSHATAVLTSLRTVSGAIGAAVFVAIMSFSSQISSGNFGAGINMRGVNIAYLLMAVCSTLLVLLAVMVSARKNAVNDEKGAV